MTLATVGSDLRPSTRVVLIKGFDARHRLVHQLRQPQGPGTGRQPVCRAAVPLGRAGARGAHRRPGREGRAPRKATPTSPAARWIHASAPGPRRKARSSTAARCWSPMPREIRRQFLLQPPRPPHWGGYRLRPTSGSSGRAARAGCTTACATAAGRRRLAARAAGALSTATPAVISGIGHTVALREDEHIGPHRQCRGDHQHRERHTAHAGHRPAGRAHPAAGCSRRSS
jgi:hypothetical protein